MKRSNHALATLLCAPLLAALATAGDAKTSATATSTGTRSGTAAASATYRGDVGFARTDTKTGKISEWDGSVLLAEPCTCGIYNPVRSVELLREKAPLYALDRW